jgi:hypothetical protein
VPDQRRLNNPDAVALVQLALAPSEPAALHYLDLGADVLQVAANVRLLTISTNSAIALKRVFIWFFLSDWAPAGLCALQNPGADERAVS